MHTDAILPRPMPLPLAQHDPASDPTEAVGGLAPIDQVRQQVALALFGAPGSPTLVGRFQVQRLVGAGGMGVVYAAHDPQLDRTVALKLLQPMTSGERARERLQREAQAMARLQHPNVVGVFETGIHGDQVFVAMEYVEGGTLGDWLRVRPRPWTEVIDMLCQAGDGLSAAHQVGLVHRDFKPANILLSGTRARISDFGLARPAADASELERTSDDDGLLLASPLTRTGALIGTPAYMAPELLHGGAASPASDQFAFGVVLHEACHGHRPFVGDTVAALMTAIDAGRIATPTRGDPLPASVTAIIRRALDPDPARRFTDMPALLTRLRRARGDRARVPGLRAMAVLTAAVSVAAGLALLAFSQPDHATPDPLQPISPIAAGPTIGIANLLGVGFDADELPICSDDAPVCAIDRALATRLAAEPRATFVDGAKVMPSVKDGVARGLRLYGIKPDTTLSTLGFKNGDLIVAIGQNPIEAFVPALQRLLATGGTIRVERKGVVHDRRFVVK